MDNQQNSEQSQNNAPPEFVGVSRRDYTGGLMNQNPPPAQAPVYQPVQPQWSAPQPPETIRHPYSPVTNQQPTLKRPKKLPRLRSFSRGIIKLPKPVWAVALIIIFAGSVYGIKVRPIVEARARKAAFKAQFVDDTYNKAPTESGNAPSTKNYLVPAEQPRVLTITKTGVEARIVPIGLNKLSKLESPSTIFDAAWYTGSVKPGSKEGVVLIEGHAKGPTKKGIFNNLDVLKEGDEIQLERGDGKKFVYKVTSSESFDDNQINMSKAMLSSVIDKPGLNLVQAAGQYDESKKAYPKRLVVYAVLKSQPK